MGTKMNNCTNSAIAKSVMKKAVSAVLIMFMLSQMTGCLSWITTQTHKMGYIRSRVQFEFRVGRNAKTMNETVESDVFIDKDKFVDLFNEEAQYDPNIVKHKTDSLDLKIVPEKEPDDWEEITSSEINIRAVYEGQSRSVSVYEFDSKLYFFVLSMGKAAKPEQTGYYYMELSDEMSSYWSPILKKIREDAQTSHMEKYGSFTVDMSYSYDNKYSAKIIDSGDNIMILITGSNNETSSFVPCRKSDFYGICWENDNYNLWVQSGDIGVICYRFEKGKWSEDPDAVRPDYIVSKYD